MGMAPDGNYDEKIYKMLSSVINYKNFRFYPSASSSKTRFLGDMLKINGYFDTQEKMEIYSYNLQKRTEDLFLKFIDDLHNLYPEYKQLCLSGGLFANVKLNQKLNELEWVDEIYIYPPMGDEGLSLGACIYKAVELGEITEPIELTNVYFGKSYNNDEIQEISKDYSFKREPYNPKDIANYINQGEIIGWFQSGSEYGPRALGARSILVRPTEVSTHKVLNQRLNRYDTMPFAPIIMEEYFDNVFTPSKSKYTSEFMTLCYNTNEEWIDRIPSVIQKSDKTARPQIVKHSKIPKFWGILNEYHKLSGIPLLLNTSFNSHNQPIIENPQQAFESLKLGVIDKLIIEDYVYFS
jgi:carbamoyltransferase